MTVAQRSIGIAVAVLTGLGADKLGAAPALAAIAGVFGFWVVYVIFRLLNS